MLTLINYCDKSILEFSLFLNELNIPHVLTDKEAEIIHSEKIILYGTGNTKAAIKYFHIQNLFTVLRICRKPFLGIGTGCSLLTDFAKDDKVACLGVFKGSAELFNDIEKLENTGMQKLKQRKETPLLSGITENDSFYFNNKLFIPQTEHTTSFMDNGNNYSATLEKDNFYGIQFLPEKSGEAGVKVLTNFLNK